MSVPARNVVHTTVHKPHPFPLKVEPLPRRAVATWIPAKEYDLFAEIAKSHGVTVSTYLRAIINDALAEEGPKVHTLFTEG